MSLAERLAPKLPGLIHPGDDDTPPFPLIIPSFQTGTLPEGMAAEMANDMGMPTPDICLHFLEAVIDLIRVETGIDLNDPDLLPERQAALKEELTGLREVVGNKAVLFKEWHSDCGVLVGKARARDLHTDKPKLPCDLVQHKCRSSAKSAL